MKAIDYFMYTLLTIVGKGNSLKPQLESTHITLVLRLPRIIAAIGKPGFRFFEVLVSVRYGDVSEVNNKIIQVGLVLNNLVKY